MDLEAALARGRRIYLIDLLWRTTERYGRDDGDIYATATAYRVLLSLFPLLIVFGAVFGLLTAPPALGPWLAQITASRPPGDNLKRLVETISGVPVTTNSVAGLAGLVALVWSASGMFSTLRRALNRSLAITDTSEF